MRPDLALAPELAHDLENLTGRLNADDECRRASSLKSGPSAGIPETELLRAASTSTAASCRHPADDLPEVEEARATEIFGCPNQTSP